MGSSLGHAQKGGRRKEKGTQDSSPVSGLCFEVGMERGKLLRAAQEASLGLPRRHGLGRKGAVLKHCVGQWD